MLVRKANETLLDFKERWTDEMSYIQDVPEVMQISAFISNSKCPELARRFSDQFSKMNSQKRGRERYPKEIDHRGPHMGEDVKGQTTVMTSTLVEITTSRTSFLGKITEELQLQLPSCPPMVGTPKKENLDRRQHGNNNGKGNVINMAWTHDDNRKRKSKTSRAKDWLNVLITFPPIPVDDVSDEPLILEAEVEGYLVRRVFVDQGATVQVMFEHCFDNLSPSIKALLTQTQTDLVRFSKEQLMLIGKIKLEVSFENEELRAVSSTIHVMMNFPTPRGIATLVARTAAVFECKQLEEKRMIQEEKAEEKEPERQEDSTVEEILVNPAFPEHKVTIETQLSKECRL
ncbi:hypothetical protein Tco_1495025 [Tanacetum coccineum]